MMDPNGGRAGGGLGHGGLDEHRMLYQDSRATGSALSGLSQKQGQIYKELFQSFSGDGRTISAIEFFKLCKLCKIYPTVITFEDLKKIVLKNREFWLLHQKYEAMGSAQQRISGDGEVELPEPSPDNSFPFDEFVNAFRIVGRIGYA
jgi:hypothetical protein